MYNSIQEQLYAILSRIINPTNKNSHKEFNKTALKNAVAMLRTMFQHTAYFIKVIYIPKIPVIKRLQQMLFSQIAYIQLVKLITKYPTKIDTVFRKKKL